MLADIRMRPGIRRFLISAAMIPAWFLPEFRSSSTTTKLIVGSLEDEVLSTVTIGEPGRPFSFKANDHYWARLLSPLFRYEAEVQNVGELAARHGARTFVDGGANIGFWSSTFSGVFDNVIAVEPGDYAHNALEQNTTMCENVVRRKAAIWDQADQHLYLEVPDKGHPAAAVRADESANTQSVVTTTVDSLVARSDAHKALIKLDVEGAEERALEGAASTISAGAVFILEEHGSDESCATYAAVQRLIPNPVVLLLHQRSATRIQNVDQLVTLKTRRGVGYNVLAFSADSNIGEAIARDLETSGRTVQERIWRVTSHLLRR